MVGCIGFVTYDGLPLLTADDRLGIEAVAARGYEARPVVWTDRGVDWLAFDAIVLRSCWDYHRRPREFVDWLETLDRAGAPLHNSVSLARWNMDKTYLRDLQRAGVSIVPTRWIEPGTMSSLAQLRDDTGWTDVVLKPSVSATAWQLHRVPASEDVLPDGLLRALDTQRFLAQPFVDDIVQGEWSLIFFDGDFSHAVVKRPREGEFRVQEEFGGRAVRTTPSAALIEDASRILAAAPEQPLYARVDGIDTREGFVLLELELIEPALFLSTDSAAPARFAEAITGRGDAGKARSGG